jgi:hypothetical protein
MVEATRHQPPSARIAHSRAQLPRALLASAGRPKDAMTDCWIERWTIGLD